MTITYQKFEPLADSAFSFTATLDGVPYNVVVTWNIYGQRWYVNIYTTQGALVYATPLIESPDGYDISMVDGLFNDSLVFRDTSQQFEMNDAPVAIIPGAYLAPQDYMLDASGNQFMLGSSQLGAGIPGQLFDALGNPFILGQSALSGDVMLDASGQQLILGPSDQLNPGMLTAYFAIAPVVGAIITAIDANGVEYPMGTGDAVQTNFATSAADTLTLPAQVYKTDWQGRQLQYKTARTNLLKWASDFTQGSGAAWFGFGAAPTLSNVAGTLPDGTAGTVTQAVFAAGATSCVGQISALAHTSQSYAFAIWARVPSGTANIYANIEDGSVAPAAGNYTASGPLPLTTAWMRIGVVGSSSGGGNVACVVGYDARIPGQGTAPATTTVQFYIGQLEVGAVSTSGIQTTTAPITVIDYTENIGGGVLAATQDLSSQQMLGANGQPLTLDGSQI